MNCSEDDVREKRHAEKIRPGFKKVDTCAAEFQSDTPYLYSTYENQSDAPPTDNKKIMILGGGPNRIGQGIEFDYCCVHAAFSLEEAGYETIMVNCNPETVSTDFDTSDRLYFEPLTLEDVLEVVAREKPDGVIIQYGGQTPLRLSAKLKELGVPVIGTPPEAIDATEDREKFRDLLDKLGLKQAESGVASNEAEAVEVANRVDYPLMVRPSFVLGGRAMAIIHNEEELRKYINESVSVSYERPVLLDRFLDNAVEVDVDAVCDGERVIVAGIVEHIERAGIHSGDSSFMLPSKNLSREVLSEIESAAKSLAKEVGVKGLMNVQFAVVGGSEVYIIEVNPRASRSVPFVSKITGIPWAKVGARVMAGESLKQLSESGVYGQLLRFEDYQASIAGIPYVAVKESVFPFVKFRGVDAMLGPEMRSTGEVMGIDTSVEGGFIRAQKATGVELPLKGKVFLSIKDADKKLAILTAKKVAELGFEIVATEGTLKFLSRQGIEATQVNKVREGSPHIVDALESGEIEMVINTPEGTGPLLDSRSIRSTATSLNIPLFTTVAAAEAAVLAIEAAKKGDGFGVKSLQEYIETIDEASTV
jgi:carbamoyl-phosphate synthase large subunit